MQRENIISTVLFLSLVSASGLGPAACSGSGSGDGDDDPGPGGSVFTDAAQGGDDDDEPDAAGEEVVPEPTTCLASGAASGWSAPEAMIGPQEDDATKNVRFLWAEVSTGGKPGYIELSLWDGFGPFTAGAVPGTYTITDDDECGLCAAHYIPEDPNNEDGPTQTQLATSGTVTIDAVDGNLRGSVSNLVFVWTDMNSGEVHSDCQTTLSSATFDVPLTTDDGT